MDANYDFPVTYIPFPVEGITGVWEFSRPRFFNHLCYSLSGHLIHLVTRGSYTVRINELQYKVKEGDVIYYYDSEEVESLGDSTEVTFYSVSYQATKFSPLPYDKRVFSADKDLQALFHKLYAEFTLNTTNSKNYLVFGTLLNILARIEGLFSWNSDKEIEKELWWSIESRVRGGKCFRPTLIDLSKISGYSRSTVIRSCQKATGDSPLRRIQIIRMERAKALLNFAHMNVTPVAEYLGYQRVHEFSREFSKFYGNPPSHLLKRN